MRRNVIFIAFCMLIVFSIYSCTRKKKDSQDIKVPIERINVEVLDSELDGAFDNFFEKSRIVAFETTRESVIGTIGRIIMYKDLFFVLNRDANNVLVFDASGKFLNKIGKKGNGMGVYDSLTDFVINEDKNLVILYSDRPYKLLTYQLDGKFLSEEYLDGLYTTIAYKNDRLLLMNQDVRRDFRIFIKTLDNSKLEGFLSMNKSDKTFQNFVISNPYIVKSKNTYIYYPYCDTVFTIMHDQIIPKYVIDFGKGSMPKDIFDRGGSAENIFNMAKEMNYGYRITNFRETNDYITFSYGNNRVIVYSKELKKAKAFDLILNKDQLPLINYFAHDGDDNNFITLYSAKNFRLQMDSYQKIDTLWNKMPQDLKRLNKTINETSNPLIILSTLK